MIRSVSRSDLFLKIVEAGPSSASAASAAWGASRPSAPARLTFAATSTGTSTGASPATTFLASPQSQIETSPCSPSMMFRGFKSRWMTPLSWAKAIPWQIPWKIERRRTRP